jgi:hypothetical protein
MPRLTIANLGIADVSIRLMAPPQQSLPWQLACMQSVLRLIDKHAQRSDDKDAGQQNVGN